MDAAALLADAIKSQKVRAFDIYALGPFLLYAAFASKRGLGKWPRRALFTAGVFTIIYNVKSYQALAAKVSEESEGIA